MNARTILILYLIIINLAAVVLMAADKLKAVEHRFRIPESVLLLIAIIGGSIGSIAAMFLFHHKTRKPKFRRGLPLILFIQILLTLFLWITSREIIFI